MRVSDENYITRNLKTTDFKKIKKSLKKYISKIDPKIKNTLKMINKNSNVATSYSCQGHAEELHELLNDDGSYFFITTENNAYVTVHTSKINIKRLISRSAFLEKHKRISVRLSTCYTSSAKNRMGATVNITFRSTNNLKGWDPHFWKTIRLFLNRNIR